VTVDELLTDLQTDYEVRGHASIRTLKSHVAPLTEKFGPDRAVNVTTARLQEAQKEWQRGGTAPATINRRMTSLKRAYSLALKGGKINRAPTFPAKLPELNARQGFFEKAEFLAVAAQLEPDLRDLAEWCFVTGMRKGEATKLT
jgi:integrase